MLRIAFPKGRDLDKTVESADKLLGSINENLLRIPITEYVYEWMNRKDGGVVATGVFMRARHIPKLVTKGNYDVGICGYDWAMEFVAGGEGRPRIGFCYPPLVDVVLFCAEEDAIKNPTEVPGAGIIYTEYPNLTRRYFEQLNGCDAVSEVEFCEGSAEAHVPHDGRFGVAVRETGKTLGRCHQRVLDVILAESGITLVMNSKWQLTNDAGWNRGISYGELHTALMQTGAFARRSA